MTFGDLYFGDIFRFNCMKWKKINTDQGRVLNPHKPVSRKADDRAYIPPHRKVELIEKGDKRL